MTFVIGHEFSFPMLQENKKMKEKEEKGKSPRQEQKKHTHTQEKEEKKMMKKRSAPKVRRTALHKSYFLDPCQTPRTC